MEEWEQQSPADCVYIRICRLNQAFGNEDTAKGNGGAAAAAPTPSSLIPSLLPSVPLRRD